MKNENINYEHLFNDYYNFEFVPTNNVLLRIAHEIKANNISTEDIYKIIDDFYKTRDYNTDGDYLEFMMENWDK